MKTDNKITPARKVAIGIGGITFTLAILSTVISINAKHDAEKNLVDISGIIEKSKLSQNGDDPLFKFTGNASFVDSNVQEVSAWAIGKSTESLALMADIIYMGEFYGLKGITSNSNATADIIDAAYLKTISNFKKGEFQEKELQAILNNVSVHPNISSALANLIISAGDPELVVNVLRNDSVSLTDAQTQMVSERFPGVIEVKNLMSVVPAEVTEVEFYSDQGIQIDVPVTVSSNIENEITHITTMDIKSDSPDIPSTGARVS